MLGGVVAGITYQLSFQAKRFKDDKKDKFWEIIQDATRWPAKAWNLVYNNLQYVDTVKMKLKYSYMMNRISMIPNKDRFLNASLRRIYQTIECIQIRLYAVEWNMINEKNHWFYMSWASHWW